MTEYREPPAPKPVVVVMQERVMAIDPRSGRLIWSQRMLVDMPPKRLFVVEDQLFVCVPRTVHCFHLESGRHLGSVPLSFEVEAGVVDADHLILAGQCDSACLTLNGSVVWTIGMERVPGDGVLDFKMKIVCRDGKGAPVWESEPMRPKSHPPALVVGDQVVQPDLVGHR